MKQLLVTTLSLSLFSGFCLGEREQDAGLYAIWVSPKKAEQVYSLPYITGGQTVVQWRDVEPAQGVYDFSAIDERMRWFAERNQKASLQVNGNLKPLWLFEKVPYHPDQLSQQVRDKKGSLMFWYPVHRDAYLDMLKALSTHLQSREYREAILGIRLNFNPFGTEHHTPKGNPDMALDQWIVPIGVDPTSIQAFSHNVVDDYLHRVIETYIDQFGDVIKVFVRNGVKDSLIESYLPMFENGTLSWFHTSSEAEPRASFAEKKYQRFYDYARSGKTTAYAEPWASAWGHHGGLQDDRWCSPPQWMYWRLLNDLHCGVSFIAIYATDLQVAMDGTYRSSGFKYEDGPDGNYQEEFQAALDFANKYVGFHASPREAPGAWIAFRENHTVLAANGIPDQRRRLKVFNNDYTFLMERLPDDTSEGQGLITMGPDNQRFGAWTRKLDPEQSMTLALDQAFSQSLDGQATIRVTYLDDKKGDFEMIIGRSRSLCHKEGTGVWKTFNVSKVLREQPIKITATKSPLYLHMVEVVRE